MSLVKYGGGIIQMSGSMAGNTFARNRYGNYVRARTKPINPQTSRQGAVRAVIQLLTTRWSQTITPTQRTAWNLYADSVSMKNKLGEVIKLSGFNHFIRSNSSLLRIGCPVVDDGPTVFELPEADTTFAITISEATQKITGTYNDNAAWCNETGGWMWLYVGAPQNAQRNFFDGPWRYTGAIEGQTGGAPSSPFVCSSAFAVSLGQRVWCYARILRADGRLSEVFRADCFCAA